MLQWSTTRFVLRGALTIMWLLSTAPMQLGNHCLDWKPKISIKPHVGWLTNNMASTKQMQGMTNRKMSWTIHCMSLLYHLVA